MDPCLSESSSIVSVSNNALIKTSSMEKNTPKDQSTLEEQEEEEQQDDKQELLLDLSLSSKDSKSELNLIDSFDLGNSSSSQKSDAQNNQGNNNTETEPRVFSCNYCQRKFYSSQALGGHQNAHKRERTLAKRGQRISSAAAANFALGHHHHHNRYSSMASLPLHGSLNRSLGIQVHSMIHKPAAFIHTNNSSSLSSSNIYGQTGWFRQAFDQQPAIGRLTTESFQSIASSPVSNNGVGKFETGRKFSPVREGFWWDSGVNHLKTKKDEIQKLDLSLKL